MGLGSKNRDYKTGDREVKARILVYKELTKELIDCGRTEEQAGKEAYLIVVDGLAKDRVLKKIKELKENRRAK